ncbi:MAG: holo-[acyl-carrier protein] synthase [Solirubrobacteraceae bacterium]|nr:holo-[acyl-carrier protein] synthase [Solirubrobacteraceae bacterium]
MSPVPRIGIDLVAVQSVISTLSRHGDRSVERVYTADEVQNCTVAGRVSAERLARTFAAKEAAAKALGGSSGAWSWRDVEVDGTRMHLHGAAAAIAEAAGISRLEVSTSSAQGCALAVVRAS